MRASDSQRQALADKILALCRDYETATGDGVEGITVRLGPITPPAIHAVEVATVNGVAIAPASDPQNDKRIRRVRST